MNLKNHLLLTAFLIFTFFAGKSQDNPIILTFPPLEAKITGNQLNVEWSTPTENNVKHYNIEISKEGKNFTKIGTVLSRADNGNSTSPLTYTFTKPASGLLTGIALFLLPLLGFSGNGAKRNKIPYIPAAIFISTIVLMGCRKSDIPEVDKTETLYLRVAQIDKADHALYSKIVKVQ